MGLKEMCVRDAARLTQNVGNGSVRKKPEPDTVKPHTNRCKKIMKVRSPNHRIYPPGGGEGCWQGPTAGLGQGRPKVVVAYHGRWLLDVQPVDSMVCSSAIQNREIGWPTVGNETHRLIGRGAAGCWPDPAGLGPARCSTKSGRWPPASKSPSDCSGSFGSPIWRHL